MPNCPVNCKCGKHAPRRATKNAPPPRDPERLIFFRKLKANGATHAQCLQYWAEYKRNKTTSSISFFD